MRNQFWLKGLALFGVLSLMVVAGNRNAEASFADDLVVDVAAYTSVYQVSGTDKIPYGITVGGVPVGGMTVTEAASAVGADLDKRLQTKVTLSLEGETRTYTVYELGIRYNSPAEEIAKAATLGRSGTLLQRYCQAAELSYEGYDYPVSYRVDPTIAPVVVAAFSDEVEQEPVEATIRRENGTFIVTHDQTGVAVDENTTANMLVKALNNWDGNDIYIEVTARVTKAEKTYEALSTIHDKLAGFSTICGDLLSNRGLNVTAGAAKLDGSVVMPGEQFSVVDCLAPFTVENGYYVGVAFNNGGYMDSIGGGVCSLSSTLYNALLRAEIQIDARWNHSMVVSYCEWGFDSTVNDDGSRDLIFTNNTGYPIYIEAYGVYGVPDGWLYFNIYGTETRDMSRRQLSFYNEIIEVEYADVSEYTFIEDTSLPYGYQVWDQGTYPYAVVDAYKDVYYDGQLISHELLHRDNYRKSAAIIRQNTTDPSVTEDSVEAEP